MVDFKTYKSAKRIELNRIQGKFDELTLKEENKDMPLKKETDQIINKIIKLIEDKEIMHREEYKKFVNETRNIMNGHSIKADTCKEIVDLIKYVRYESL